MRFIATAAAIAAGLVLLGATVPARAGAGKVPILYSTDLFHPHEDPDDHFDLACLFAMPEFDIKGIILDIGAEQKNRMGRPPVEQMMHITRRQVPYAVGLGGGLRSRTDKALDQPAEFQGGVKLILSVLRDSSRKVTLFTTGSCRDVAAAYNREPELFRQKVRAFYYNVGRGPSEAQNERNVSHDPAAYLRCFEMNVPLYWCPCFGNDGYGTFYTADQTAVVGACTQPVRNYFVYCLTRSKADPLAFLTSGPHPLPTGRRSMWCTAPMFHAAGRQVYARGVDDFVALPPAEAAKAGPGREDKALELYRFVPIRAEIRDGGRRERRADDPPGGAARGQRGPHPGAPGDPTAAYWGRTKDRVGTKSPEPDGRLDCCVRVLGVEASKPIRNVVLTGPRDGRWELVKTDRWWRVAAEREGKRLDVYFQFYAPGEHRVEITYEDGTSRSAAFVVPDLTGSAGEILHVEVGAAQPNAFVFRATDDRYAKVLAACLKNLLAGLGDRGR